MFKANFLNHQKRGYEWLDKYYEPFHELIICQRGCVHPSQWEGGWGAQLVPKNPNNCPSPITIVGDQIMPIRSNSVYQSLTIYETFYMEMEIFVTEPNTINDWTNLIHFTIGWNYGRPGDRTPGITEIFFLHLSYYFEVFGFIIFEIQYSLFFIVMEIILLVRVQSISQLVNGANLFLLNMKKTEIFTINLR